jgi:hypothetical protein
MLIALRELEHVAVMEFRAVRSRARSIAAHVQAGGVGIADLLEPPPGCHTAPGSAMAASRSVGEAPQRALLGRLWIPP